MNDGLPWLPDSDISHPVRPTQTELRLMEAVRARWPSARPIMGRYGSPPDSLAQAARTGRLTLRQGAVVRAIDVERGKATGVSWVDAITRREHATRAPLIFLCASALESTRILLLSQDRATGRPLGRASEALGRYLMDHIRLFFRGSFEAGSDDGPATEPGRCVYLPRFDARGVDSPGPGRGFGVQVSVNAVGGGRAMVSAGAFGEMRPRAENRVVVDPSRIDRWGIPILRIDCAHREEELRLGADQRLALLELAETLGVRQLELEAAPRPPGLALHECGTARMGDDPATSVLDPHNQCWDASGLFVVDGAAFVSQGSQNPTLTIMALTARACAHAVGRASYPLHSP
jgi:choline dehydrogenase-like flavoprotein